MEFQDSIDPSQSDFDGFPRRLPDNCVEYMLFILDNQLDPRALLAELETIRRAATQLCNQLTKGYIWQRDSFRLQLERDDKLTFLHGTTDYGDSIEDEWLIVYLLRELSKTFPSLWIRIFDSDGEFLLVEAANVLPKWLSPEIDSNRVWINQGHLRILPLAASAQEKRPLSLVEAVNYIKSCPDNLLHSTFLEAEAFYRLEKYPAHITESIHHTVVTIPRNLAYVLHEIPAAIAPAVEAFYLRDPVAVKQLASPSRELRFPPHDLVTISVRFTKVLFAQLKSQQFTPPPIWASVIDAAETQVVSQAQESQKRLARLEMGMKVTSGFEMLAVNAENRGSRLAREFAIFLQDLEEDGSQALPDDQHIQAWPEVARDDDDSWLDINFEDLENELQGSRAPREGTSSGFGDPKAEANLRKIVSRFENFLNDETAGVEGVEMSDMDMDDDLSDQEAGSSSDDDEEDKEVSFDEEQFSNMMREMMGLPPENTMGSQPASTSRGSPTGRNVDGHAEEDDREEIQNLTAQMEAELNSFGALKLNPGSERSKSKALQAQKDLPSKDKSVHLVANQDEDEDSDGGDIDIDYNLAKNLLESFKSQAGTAGPASNILGMMGLKLPRDEDEDEDEQGKENTMK
ncbi:SGT1 protein-domain-containing protein [Xylariomycetidae sp. FL2044]|nr:SGT1 protein-domain-containing protein [Xylariomycetidae sp. FL2044]